MENRPNQMESEAGREIPAKPTVLVVDDDESVRRLVSRFLSLSGFRVLAAGSGPAAIPLWREHRDSIDLLLTDMVMPEGVNGFRLAAQLQAERPGLRTLFTSGYDTDLAGEDGVLLKGLHFLPKPYRPEQLTAAVQAALDGTPGTIPFVC